METKITCPNCHCQFDVDEVLTRQAQDKLAASIRKELSEQFAAESRQAQKELEQRLQEQFSQKYQNEQAQLTQKLQAREDLLAKMRAENLEFLKQKDAWELEKQNLKLENQKELNAQRQKLQEELSAKIAQEQQLKMAEKDKKLADFELKVAELQRKLEQGSQQLQGEVLELELEDTLRQEFPDDIIEAIGKGVNGADVRQRVFDTNGSECGKIIWESKRTKNFTASWIPKLKADLRTEKGDLAVLMTTTMPKGIEKKFAFYQGVWLCQPELATFVAQLLRFNLIRVGFVIASQESKDAKVEALYRYLTGPEFVAKIESQLETIASMRQSLDKEKKFYDKLVSQKEQQINQLQTAVVTMYGGLQGVTHNALPGVKQLELE
ncbi:DUF2130 domain-containing protein [bacterium]|nr:DUF2130 domain-containing protein [bacterium]MBQ6436261.1 DUF2130 domain-containing protein [bacterium]